MNVIIFITMCICFALLLPVAISLGAMVGKMLVNKDYGLWIVVTTLALVAVLLFALGIGFYHDLYGATDCANLNT